MTTTTAKGRSMGEVPTTVARAVPLVDEIAAVIRERIYSHHYPTGAWLRQEHLAAELNVSRTPLREALRRLEQEGLVTHESGRGMRIVSGDAATLIDAYELRGAVDALAARLTATEATASDVRSLRRLIDAQRATVTPWDARAYTKLNVDFHEMIMVMTGNQFVIAQSPILRMTGQVFAPIAHTGPRNAVQAIQEHVEIVDAIEAGDAERAEQMARTHIDRTITELRAEADRRTTD
ncbi:GntR family transcriptional regulator [Microbacterium esteraromaticum]|uniref:GntR family transcriptional regulator n=2 Tax=Microbacterium esteraromaticum TaxID=57043 RepID=A0A939IUW9_9MICO|nr:GntR family transcriptional regulator [Microbacterium esteraromaticum]MBN8205449.1 GntR family transcriptional regulator [Microbacterium esteraromaticum]MBN8415603.1 GntR family transcriptional regulator [Microbacterium esteraromaticum]MBN8424051.1 GntR family transcriptional regulator [Microbacterium esteraromaticum]MBY6060411.1 GntR family transcriptional regulator [Microbacterium esteraromaticum]